VELLLDAKNPVHWIVVAVLVVSGAAATFIGVRDGFLRRSVRTSSGLMTGSRAVVAGILYVATGLAGVVGAVVFVLRALAR
jgi:hypothetical protein